ncbi:signal peptide peptidase SppA [Bradyrhizobium sp. GM6.1]
MAPVLERIARGPVHDTDVREMFGGKRASDAEARQLAERLASPTILTSSKQGRFTALVSCHGIAMYDVESQPYAFSTLRLSQVMGRLSADPTIETILLDIDSPGGYVTGTTEAADAIYAARERKKVIALVNPLAASAAYWLASQAETIIGVPSADVGSIGVFMCHYDCSAMLQNAGVKPTYIYAGEYKTEGNSSEPLSKDARTFLQSQIDSTYSDFVAAVARGRRASTQTVLANFGKGRVYDASTAKRLGMIDEIKTIDQAMAAVASGASKSSLHAMLERERADNLAALRAIANAEASRPKSAAEIRALIEAEARR